MKHYLLLVIATLASMGIANADDTYVKVTSTSQLVVGDEYIIAADNAGTVYVATAFSSNALSSTNVGFTVEGNSITVSTASPLVFTLGGNAEGYTLKYDGKYYLGYGTSTSLRQQTSPSESNEKWTYNYSDTYSEFLLQNVGTNTRYLVFRILSETPVFRPYTTTSLDNGVPTACLYVKTNSMNITLAAACTDGVRYYGTYSSGNAFVVPSDLTVAEIKVAESKLTVSNYATGDVVPANTGVMVSAATAGAHPVVISGETGTSVLGAENMLKPSGNGITAGEMAEANSGCKFYRLTMHGGTTLGYYYGAAGGAAFALAANKAYLAVPTAGARTGFDWAEETTDIAGVSISGTTDNATPCYNLNGQRVTEAAKGIVIRNGKKIMKR